MTSNANVNSDILSKLLAISEATVGLSLSKYHWEDLTEKNINM